MTDRAKAIDSMCMTWRHDFGLDRPEGDAGFLCSGMTSSEREALRRAIGQLYDHHVVPATARAYAAGMTRAAEIATDWGDARVPEGGGNALRNCADAIRAEITKEKEHG